MRRITFLIGNKPFSWQQHETKQPQSGGDVDDVKAVWLVGR